MLKVGIVGVGYLGKFHVEKYSMIDSVEIAAICDSNETTAKEIAKKYRANLTTDYKDLIKFGINCASIATTTATHYEIAKYLLENGIDLLIEKPITSSYQTALELINIAKRNNRIIQVGHLERFNPAFQKFNSLANHPRFFEIKRLSTFVGRGIDVDVIKDLMIHDIDLLLSVATSPIKNIDAVGTPVITDSVDIANVRVVFESGVMANLTASRVSLSPERSFRVFQKDSYLSIDLGKKTAKKYSKIENSTGIGEISSEQIEVESGDSLFEQIQHFIKCVKDRETPIGSGEDGAEALRVAELINNQISEKIKELKL